MQIWLEGEENRIHGTQVKMKHNRDSDLFERRVSDLLSKCTYVDAKKSQLDLTHSHGLFSNCTATLWALTKIYPSERFVRVNWPSQNKWRDEDQAGKNLFDLYFEQNNEVNTHYLTNLPPVDHHGIYADLRFDKLKPYVESYFVPSVVVRKKQAELVSKYNIDYENTIGLLYRGTDKWTEVAPIPSRYYLLETRRLLAKDHNLRVLVQTDQEQVKDHCMMQLGKQAFYISEMPVTSSLIGVHNMPTESRKILNFEFGITLLAVVSIIAKCRYVVTHTGNVSLWVCLYRGTAKNTCQLRPRPPDLISNYVGESGSIERSNVRDHVYASILEDEVYELLSENIQVRSELNAIKSHSVMYKYMRFLASNIDTLFPDETKRGEVRRRITLWLRRHSSSDVRTDLSTTVNSC